MAEEVKERKTEKNYKWCRKIEIIRSEINKMKGSTKSKLVLWKA